jgi:hypothetical protein
MNRAQESRTDRCLSPYVTAARYPYNKSVIFHRVLNFSKPVASSSMLADSLRWETAALHLVVMADTLGTAVGCCGGHRRFDCSRPTASSTMSAANLGREIAAPRLVDVEKKN